MGCVVPVRLGDFGDLADYGVVMSDKLTMTIVYDERDEEGWIVAAALGVPGAISQGRTRVEARENLVDALRLMLTHDDEDLGSLAVGRSEPLELTLSD
jgi:predicted RNase H-like HicB family nuclease